MSGELKIKFVKTINSITIIREGKNYTYLKNNGDFYKLAEIAIKENRINYFLNLMYPKLGQMVKFDGRIGIVSKIEENSQNIEILFREIEKMSYYFYLDMVKKEVSKWQKNG